MNIKSQENSPASNKFSAQGVNPLLLSTKYELRDTLKEIVYGLPGVKKVASILKKE